MNLFIANESLCRGSPPPGEQDVDTWEACLCEEACEEGRTVSVCCLVSWVGLCFHCLWEGSQGKTNPETVLPEFLQLSNWTSLCPCYMSGSMSGSKVSKRMKKPEREKGERENTSRLQRIWPMEWEGITALEEWTIWLHWAEKKVVSMGTRQGRSWPRARCLPWCQYATI